VLSCKIPGRIAIISAVDLKKSSNFRISFFFSTEGNAPSGCAKIHPKIT